MTLSTAALDSAALIAVGRGILLGHGLTWGRMQLGSWSGGIGLSHLDFLVAWLSPVGDGPIVGSCQWR